MPHEKMNDSDFPAIAFATLPTTGETIAIQYGQRIHYRVNTTKSAQELNTMYGVTPAQALAVLERVLADEQTSHARLASHDPQRRSA
jgi:ribulose bisphosphate carboxylase small subunit